MLGITALCFGIYSLSSIISELIVLTDLNPAQEGRIVHYNDEIS